MGIFEDFKEANRSAEYMAADAKQAAINRVIDSLSDTLAEPIFQGDIDTALVHFMGEEAFNNDGLVAKYQNLAKRIKEEQAKGHVLGVPVLVIAKSFSDAPTRDTAFVRIGSEGVNFASETEMEEGAVTHAFAGKTVIDQETGREKWESQKSTITHKTLSIVGNTSIYSGDLLRSGSMAENLKYQPGFVLSESHTAPGGGGIPSDFSFTNYAYDKLNDDHLENSALNSTGETMFIVGWDAIDQAIAAKVISVADGDLEKTGEKLTAFLNTLDLTPYPYVESPLPLTDEFVKKYQEFKQVATS